MGALAVPAPATATTTTSESRAASLPRFDAVISTRDYRTSTGDITDEMRAAADIKRLTIDGRAARILTLGLKMAHIPETPPETVGTVATYTITFDTVNRRGSGAISGRVAYYSRDRAFFSTSATGQACPGAVVADPATDWVTFTMSKACFPGKHRRVVRYVADVGAATLQDRGGVLMTGNDEIRDYTDARQARRVAIR